MAYQFIHVDKYAKSPSSLAQKNKGKIWSAREIASEAMRVDGNCNHVKNPKQPQVIYGEDPLTIVEAAEALLSVSTDSKGRKSRPDTNILVAGVTSFPTPSKELNDPEKIAAYNKWRSLTLEFLKKEYGENLKGVVEHTDEEYPHLHFYAFNQEDITKTRKLHAGDRERGESKTESAQRLRDYQDRYFEQVSVKVGMLRTGPRRKRLSREDYFAEKEMAHKVAWVYGQIEETKQQINKELEDARDFKKEASILRAAAHATLEKAEQAVKKATKEAREEINKNFDLIFSHYERLTDAALEVIEEGRAKGINIYNKLAKVDPRLEEIAKDFLEKKKEKEIQKSPQSPSVGRRLH